MKTDEIIDITADVKWIGIPDPDLATFDIVMETQYGTTYNSYFINAEKKTIIETSKENFKDVYLEKVKKVVNPVDVEYIVLDHTEPDHSGNLKHLLKICPNATVVGSGTALTYLQDMIDFPFKSLRVKDGDTLSLGNKTLRFISAPNLHWADSIFTYLEEDQLLFTCDSFGAHYCPDKIFDDQIGDYEDAYKFYFDTILKPFSKFMLKAIEKIRPLEIKAICTGHGPILRSSWRQKVDLAEKYASEYLSDTATEKGIILVAYVSAYGYTKNMAVEVVKGIKSVTYIPVEVVDIEKLPLGELEEKVVKSRAILVGSPTINQNTLLPVYRLFSVINPIRDKGKLAASFGSYGWSGEAVKIIEDTLTNLKLKIACEGLREKFYPYDGKAEKSFELGKQFGTAVQQKE